ncbi:hypothetical protein [Planobispora takensis]|uniref:HNH endonuclease n=1 Tax=Planobispora takensis TaxID=1367882 RepID=A0A8J3WPA6_9ACTN|nr:hypothetical protein [Planobispora takensis]GIH98104.1 hypothetical protein Pta02_01130 [Planobispora takensis]
MFAMFGDLCHLCGHHGAGEADHLVPVAIDADQPIDPYGMRPAHGSSSPCPVCSRKCNQERGTGTIIAPLYTSQDW